MEAISYIKQRTESPKLKHFWKMKRYGYFIQWATSRLQINIVNSRRPT